MLWAGNWQSILCSKVDSHPYCSKLNCSAPSRYRLHAKTDYHRTHIAINFCIVTSKSKNIADPVHGFITVPGGLLLKLLQTPEMQRLRRIRQLGAGNLVFPSAEHSRFGHALGSMALMQDVLRRLKETGTPISEEEQEAALAAALLHDVGHTPYSHALEYKLIHEARHEDISLAVMQTLDKRFQGRLKLALGMFQKKGYSRSFFHDLVASQLDVDRLDYLRRDSYFTGVIEGHVGTERVIRTMRVHPADGGCGSRVVIEQKAIYAVENVLIARRLMYWQVYVHKTVLAGDSVLLGAINRARNLLECGNSAAVKGISPTLRYFLATSVGIPDLDNPDVLRHFVALDDTDVQYSLKQWVSSSDPILADLSKRLLQRDLFRCTFLPDAPSEKQYLAWKRKVADYLVNSGLSRAANAEHNATEYYLDRGMSTHSANQDSETPLEIIDSQGNKRELSAASDEAAVRALVQLQQKQYVCYPKEAALFGSH